MSPAGVAVRFRGYTEWTELGQAEYDAKTFDAGDVKVVPGYHYVVQELEERDSYYPGSLGETIQVTTL